MWTCGECGQDNNEHRSICWNCGERKLHEDIEVSDGFRTFQTYPDVDPADERIAALEEAQGKIQEAIDLIKEACQEHPFWDRVRSYLVSQLEMAKSDDHEWLGKNYASISSIIEDIRNNEA